jgi:hypothetical protein
LLKLKLRVLPTRSFSRGARSVVRCSHRGGDVELGRGRERRPEGRHRF